MKNGGALIIESLVCSELAGKSLDVAYRRLAGEEAQEKESTQWAEATLGDVADEAR
jgi:hypothetical protein